MKFFLTIEFIDKMPEEKNVAVMGENYDRKNDNAFIAHARQDLPDCTAEIERLRADMEEIIVESGKVDISNWPAQQQICQSIANKSLGRDVNGLPK